MGDYRYGATEIVTSDGDGASFATLLRVPTGVTTAKLVLRRTRLPHEATSDDADPLDKVATRSTFLHTLHYTTLA